MRVLLVVAFAALVSAAVPLPDRLGELRPMSENFDNYVRLLMQRNNYIDQLENFDGEIELIDTTDADDEAVEPEPRFIISWQIRRFIRKMQKQMPCGWPDYGIPPLAPLRKTDAKVHLKKGIVETFDDVFRLRVDGLDNFKIKKFTLNIITNKITFDFLFKNIKVSAQHYSTDTIIDAMRQIGLSVEYEGDGNLEFGLVNLRVAGVLRYKMPILWGSIKITSLKTQVSLEKCNSHINGFLGNGSVNRFINQQIENVVVSSINENQEEISDKIESTLVPRVNKMLKGNDFWTVIDLIFKSSEGEKEDDPIVTKCVPPPDPWA